MSMLSIYQWVAIAMFGIGLFGVMVRRSLVGMLIGVELMLNGAGLSIMAAAQFTETAGALAQLSTLLVMGLAAAETTLVLAIVLIVDKRFGHVESENVSLLRG
ncbi:MAG: NADH-quinone oxidoreductase subunit NuoK [Desulfobacterales bacterium CG23_combo_of_CG06-09_8_20_14_all_51_8]|nr:MAG: NADH-quinone oxidoreductase subunit NuoK [Desulfobacterales bacterium CG23_combo_of_CG06-09_8_20_14_all_51_8]